ncbi:LEAF RUST 10 DISEASE-RESISTANCE LOCUS RECEPTOR-LIKE PROTEIN KINASE-like 1.2 [Cryptomeria japonica]|uniref:LEAF RUST 10 DISEASE-RESISTANCE LOCUS RECEPTOR-LIKE PROTEIN KINASE-like 1.2 n=1 Tax=Cryptomeria japonica TaxID=3369 RepID=UPI0027D9F85A|nr:LEAF RUST 10 DISEASE-RESISTANCE LOCUS RECEPTOR-LIKE PROTEIN KINASE-like 1.2 [Cryptomeria japonica]
MQVDLTLLIEFLFYFFLPHFVSIILTNIASIIYNSDNAGGSNTANKTAIVLGSSIGAVALIAAIAVLYILYVKRRKRPHIRGFGGDHSNYQRSDMEAGLVMNMMGNLPMFHYEELQQATNFFDEKNQLGDGGFGVVYLGKLKDGRAVAVKRLYEDRSRTVEQFMNEVQILSSLCHPNLVRLYGCTTPQSPMLLLVYEFVPNGTLSDHLHGCRRTPGGLPWVTRLDIAIETAQALAYLHNICPPILHRDVKSDNILLDEHFRAKVADFGLSRLVPVNVSHVTTAPQGTPGYVDPDYHECFQLTEKSDVYSFGVVLVEIISAKVAVDIMRNRNEISLANMATDKIKRGVLDELVDPELKIERNQEVKVTVAAVAELTFECLAIERDFRPTMKEVVARLTEIKEMLQESSESSNSVSSTPTSSLTSLQENWPGVASD